MAWIYLLVAGVFEIGFTTCLKLSEAFTRPLPSVGFVVLGGISFWLLTQAMKDIPLGTAYAAWTGIGAGGTAIIGFVFFKDPVSAWRIFFIALLIASIVGLKLVSITGQPTVS